MKCKHLETGIGSTVEVRNLTEARLAELWKWVNEEFWEDVRKVTPIMVRRLLEEATEEVLVAQPRASWYKRNRDQVGYRNGYRERDMLTRFGLFERLRAPIGRDGLFTPQVVDSYRRRQEEVNSAVRELFLRGISTREVGTVIAPLVGDGVSAQTVADVCRDGGRQVPDQLTEQGLNQSHTAQFDADRICELAAVDGFWTKDS